MRRALENGVERPQERIGLRGQSRTTLACGVKILPEIPDRAEVEKPSSGTVTSPTMDENDEHVTKKMKRGPTKP